MTFPCIGIQKIAYRETMPMTSTTANANKSTTTKILTHSFYPKKNVSDTMRRIGSWVLQSIVPIYQNWVTLGLCSVCTLFLKHNISYFF